MAFAGSLHPQLDVKYIDVRDAVRAGQYRATPNDQLLDEVALLSQVWPEPPPDDCLHVFVSLPGGHMQRSSILVNAVGMCFIRLFDLAQDV